MRKLYGALAIVFFLQMLSPVNAAVAQSKDDKIFSDFNNVTLINNIRVYWWYPKTYKIKKNGCTRVPVNFMWNHTASDFSIGTFTIQDSRGRMLGYEVISRRDSGSFGEDSSGRIHIKLCSLRHSNSDGDLFRATKPGSYIVVGDVIDLQRSFTHLKEKRIRLKN